MDCFWSFCGRAFCLPLVAGILFFQGWRLDPILQFGVVLIAAGVIAEAAMSALNVYEQNRSLNRSIVQMQIIQAPLRWPCVFKIEFGFGRVRIPAAGEFLLLHASNNYTLPLGDHCSNDCCGVIEWVGLPAGCSDRRMAARSCASVNPWLIIGFGFVLLLLNWLLAVLAARHGIMKAKSYARLKLGMQS